MSSMSPVTAARSRSLFVFLLGAILLLFGAGKAVGMEKNRTVKTGFALPFNENWKFSYFPEEDKADYSGFAISDSLWQVISVPHTWSTYETTGELHPFIKSPSDKDDPYWWNGRGIYRKSFLISKAYKDKKVFLEFDAVMKNCRVFLNGKHLGDHLGGFNSFYFDISEYVDFGNSNWLTVEVSNRRDDEFKVPPMTAGNWNLYGGIYRDVRLVVKDRLYIPFQGSYRHEGGTFVTTPKVNSKEAIVQVKTFVKNEYNKAVNCRIATTIVTSEGEKLQRMEQSRLINPDETAEFGQMSNQIVKPKLWSPETPYVYSVLTEVFNGVKLVDQYTSPLGFRWFSWDYKKNRLILNGNEIHIHGTNRHQEYPWLGDAIPKWIHKMDLEDIRFNLSHNFIRTCHYTQDKYVYDWCDRNGLIVCEEVPNIKSIDFSEEVQQQQVVEMIRRDRNHPSILFWSMGNETNDAADSEWAIKEDTTRIIHARHVKGNSAGKYARHTSGNMDMENLLRCTVRGWYNSDVKNLEPVDGQWTGNEEFQHRMARVNGGSQRGIISMGNGVMWVYADHGADREYVNAPLKHVNPKGWVDLYRQPKYMYYLWQANYSVNPMIFIHPHYWRSPYLGTTQNIVVDSNSEMVELFVNGKSRGIRYPNPGNFHTVTFENISIENGELAAVGIKDGKRVTHTLRLAQNAGKIVLTASHDSIDALRSSVVIIKADITDKDGIHVYGANNPLEWEIAGPATLVGPAEYQTDIDKKQENTGAFYIDAPVCNVIRSTGVPGIIKIRCKSDGLQSGEITLHAHTAGPNGVKGFFGIEVVVPADHRTKNLAIRKTQSSAHKLLVQNTISDLIIGEPLSMDTIRSKILEKIRNENLGIDLSTDGIKELASVFLKHLSENKGVLIADDYNFQNETISKKYRK